MHPSRFSRSVLTAVGASLLALFVAGSAEARRSASPDCTRTNVYWTHAVDTDPTWANIGPGTPFFLSGRTYFEMLIYPNHQRPYDELALDYIAAALNAYAGASMPSDVLVAFLDVQALFTAYAPSYDFVADPDGVTADFEDLRSVLALYNKGRIGPGACKGK